MVHHFINIKFKIYILGSPSFAYSNSSIQINKEEAKEEMVDFVFPKNRARR